jgi:hypothetical protein
MAFPVIAHAAATATELHALWTCPHDFKVDGVNVIASVAVTGTDTNTTHINIMDGATEKVNLDPVSGVDFVAHTRYAMTVTAWTLNAGDHLNVQLEKVGTGLALPHLELEITGQYQ